MKKQICILGLVLIPVSFSLYGFGDKTVINTRSQSVNLAREMAGWQEETHLFDTDRTYGTVAFAIEYDRSFNPEKINDALFGSCSLRFSGSLSGDRLETDIMADYFGLPLDYSSIVSFNPMIANVVFDFNWYMGFDACLVGSYIQVHFPIAYAKWDLRLHEYVINSGTQFDPAGYMGPERINRSNLPATVIEAWNGVAFGDMQDPLLYGRVNGAREEIRVADIQLTAGWDFWQCDAYLLGAFVRGSIPTGNKRNAIFLFEPVVGNQGHAALGGGLYGRGTVWTGCDGDRSIQLYGELVVEHLFNAKELRSFDFTKNGPGSRYMLLAEILETPSPDLYYGVLESDFQYSGRLFPAINQTTFPVTIAINAQVEALFAASYTQGAFVWDTGYNFWFLSKEHLKKRESFIEHRFALKGDASVYGFTPGFELPVALSPSESDASIEKGQGLVNRNFENNNVDNATGARTNGGVDVLNNLLAADTTAGPIQFVGPVPTNSSFPPILLLDSDINDQSALLPKALSHKIFTYIGGSWHDVGMIDPYCGIGVSVEWACKCLEKNSAHSQWSVWVRGGIDF